MLFWEVVAVLSLFAWAAAEIYKHRTLKRVSKRMIHEIETELKEKSP